MDTIPDVEKKIEQLKRKQSKARTQGERQYWRALIGQWQRYLVELKGRQGGETNETAKLAEQHGFERVEHWE